MKIVHRIHGTLRLALFLALCAAVNAQPRLVVKPGFGVENECSKTNEPAILTGSLLALRVQLVPEGSTPESAAADPSGLKILAGMSYSPRETFVVSRELTHQLHLRPIPQSGNPLEFVFAYDVPQTLAGRYLCLQAVWEHPAYGPLESEKIACTRVEKPCSETSMHRMWTSIVEGSRYLGELEQAVVLADSFIAQGWHDLGGLGAAILSAKKLQRYDDAIRFLDWSYETNHSSDFLSDPVPGKTRPTEDDRILYVRRRIELEEMKKAQP